MEHKASLEILDKLGLSPVADELSDGIAVCVDGRIAWANGVLASMAGKRSAADLIGEAPEALLEDGAELPEPGSSATTECRMRTTPQNPDETLVRIRRWRENLDDLPCVWVFQNRTRERQLEAEVLRLGHGLRQANLAFEQLRDHQQLGADDFEELLTVVSHELRTPVTVITGYSRLLLSEQVGDVNEEQRQFLEECIKGCQRINQFIKNLLESARNAGSDAIPQVQEGSLAPTLQSVVQSLKPLLDEQRIQVELLVDAEANTARFDPLRIEQVLTNLIDNAIKQLPPDGRIEISTHHRSDGEHDFCEVRVEDDGPGVAPEDRERIFERFVRAGEKRRAGGLGLGLAICRHLVEAHGGVIGVTDRPGGGARFWFTLPAPSRADRGLG